MKPIAILLLADIVVFALIISGVFILGMAYKEHQIKNALSTPEVSSNVVYFGGSK